MRKRRLPGRVAIDKRDQDFHKAVKIIARWTAQGSPPLLGGTQAEQVKWAREVLERVR